MALKGRSLLTLLEFTSEEIRSLLDLSMKVKKERQGGNRSMRFSGHTLAMLFEKRSTRTRSAFETAFGEEGGHPVFLSSADIQLGAKETIEDTARVIGRMFDIVEFRGFKQETVVKLAENSGIPVINGLTDMYHPTQVLADIMTVEEEVGTLSGVQSVFIGDGRNNVSRSLMIIAAKMGLHHTVITPNDLRPSDEEVSLFSKMATEQGGTLRISSDPDSITEKTQVIYTDVWVSMGEESAQHKRLKLLKPYQVTTSLMNRAPEAIFLHCLPAVRGNEMTAEVIDGPNSRVWDQSENRKHTIKAIMLAALGLE